jgi:hypothetical protein
VTGNISPEAGQFRVVQVEGGIQPTPNKRSLYACDRWLRLIQDSFGCKTKTVAVLKGNTVVAEFPLIYQSKIFFILVGSPLRGTHTEFGGVILDDRYTKAIMAKMHDYLLRDNASWIEFALQTPPENLGDVMGSMGYSREARQSIIIALDKSVEEIWRNFAGRARTEIRKAQKKSLAVQILKESDNSNYYDLILNVFNRQKRNPSFDKKFLDAVYAQIQTDNFLHCGVFYDNNLVAGALFLKDKKRIVFVSGASNAEGRRLGANSLIQWFAIQSSVEAGLTEYDMGGAGVREIDKFKKSFGGTLVEYDRYVYSSRLAILPSRLYKFAHSIGLV